MLKKQFIIGSLVAFFFFGLLGTAFAGEGDYKTVLGTDEFTFSVSDTGISEVATNHVYDQETQAKLGTEAGDWEFSFNAPETKADVAAKNYKYDQEQLSSIGTEAGGSTFNFEGSNTGVICSNC